MGFQVSEELMIMVSVAFGEGPQATAVINVCI